MKYKYYTDLANMAKVEGRRFWEALTKVLYLKTVLSQRSLLGLFLVDLY